MGKVYDTIDDSLKDFIHRQHMFFVATAPLSGEGTINLSPKGLDSLRILDERTVAFADLVGSGVETIAHVKENKRIVLMFCAFEGPPNIVRLHGRGEVIGPSHGDFPQLRNQFPEYNGLRSLIRIHCSRISDSCGFGVPLYDFVGQRSQLIDWAKGQEEGELLKYQQEKNATSIDGLPGLSQPTEGCT